MVIRCTLAEESLGTRLFELNMLHTHVECIDVKSEFSLAAVVWRCAHLPGLTSSVGIVVSILEFHEIRR